VTGTPATFVNGVLVRGAQPYESFKRVVDAALERAADQGKADVKAKGKSSPGA